MKGTPSRDCWVTHELYVPRNRIKRCIPIARSRAMGGLVLRFDAAGGREDDGLSLDLDVGLSLDLDLLSLDGDLLSLAFLSLAFLSFDPAFCPDVCLLSPTKTRPFCPLPGHARRRGALRGRTRAVGGGLGVVYVAWLLCAFWEARPLASGGSEGQRVSRRSRRLRGALSKEGLGP